MRRGSVPDGSCRTVRSRRAPRMNCTEHPGRATLADPSKITKIRLDPTDTGPFDGQPGCIGSASFP